MKLVVLVSVFFFGIRLVIADSIFDKFGYVDLRIYKMRDGSSLADLVGDYKSKSPPKTIDTKRDGYSGFVVIVKRFRGSTGKLASSSSFHASTIDVTLDLSDIYGKNLRAVTVKDLLEVCSRDKKLKADPKK